MSLYKSSAAANNMRGIFLAACSYADGTGGATSVADAIIWYNRGADMDDPSCEARLGDCYTNGDVITAVCVIR